MCNSRWVADSNNDILHNRIIYKMFL